MDVIRTDIEDLYILKPKVFEDARGYFFESFKNSVLQQHGLNYQFIQDNQSKSSYGVIRGLHFQTGEFAQAKLVRVLQGRILDVALDLRPNSPTYGKHASVELSDENKNQLLIPRGFAHGFSVLSDTAIVFYKCDNDYSKSHEDGIYYKDTTLNIDWKLKESDILISEKDAQLLPFIEK